MMRTKYSIIFFFMCIYSIASHGQSLDSLLTQAYSHNLELKALQLEYEAALQKGPQVNQLPDPLIGVGIPILRPETRLGPQILNISASQMFPWLGTLKAKEDVLVSMAKAKYERIAAARLNIDFKIKSAYFNLYLLQAKQIIIRKNVRIFETIEKVALAKVESGKSLASDVLAVRIKLVELENQVEILEQRKLTFQAQINDVLNNSPDIIIKIDTSSILLAELVYDLNLYKEKIQSNHPLINQLDWNIETSNNELALNVLAGKPSIGLGLDYSLVGKRTDAFPTNNGRDILIPKVMVSIPINQNKYQAKKQEEQLKQQAYGLQKEQLTNSLLSDIQSYKSDYESARLIFDLANSQIVISKSAYDILLSYYSSQGQRFDELMKLQSDINKYELDLLQSIVLSHLAKFKIERLTDF